MWERCHEIVLKVKKYRITLTFSSQVSHIHPYSSALTAMQTVFVKGFDALIFVNDFPVWLFIDLQYKTCKDGSVLGVTVTRIALLTHCQALTQSCGYTEGESKENKRTPHYTSSSVPCPSRTIIYYICLLSLSFSWNHSECIGF